MNGVVARGRPPAMQVPARPVIVAGTAAFFLAFVVLLPFWGWLGDHGHRVWLWTSLAGWLLGLVGMALFTKHRREGRAR
jgi:MFS family permease